jgi:hypothetical protein
MGGLYPLRARYVWPSEMDLMARRAGLQLLNGYGGWMNESFSMQVSGMYQETDVLLRPSGGLCPGDEGPRAYSRRQAWAAR